MTRHLISWPEPSDKNSPARTRDNLATLPHWLPISYQHKDKKTREMVSKNGAGVKDVALKTLWEFVSFGRICFRFLIWFGI